MMTNQRFYIPRRTLWVAALLFIGSFSEVSSSCGLGRIKKLVPEKAETFRFPEDVYTMFGAGIDISCLEIWFMRFRSTHSEFKFDHVDLEPPAIHDDYSTCQEEVALYVGTTVRPYRNLTTLCGKKTSHTYTNGPDVLLVYTRGAASNTRVRSFSLTYNRVWFSGSGSAKTNIGR
ncbi:hypothetical protein ElyMa_003600900 [Elysia marginata]|uniref:CUB domain-containing protein n=1 Tax=Elysia marginata TaxID=1093978 RepID=A0AAV4ES03_9GAST|nr:hypothetical protein ElyMa_003600900 [Elysia marginata]